MKFLHISFSFAFSDMLQGAYSFFVALLGGSFWVDILATIFVIIAIGGAINWLAYSRRITHAISCADMRGGIDEWWDEMKNVGHCRLIIPPFAVNISTKKTTKPFSAMKRTQEVVGKFYESTIGKHKNRKSLGWTLDTSRLPVDFVPLVCFVNGKSGGQQGAYFRFELNRLLNPLQVIDVQDIDPKVALTELSNVPHIRILVAGGDGSVGWILDAIESVEKWAKQRPPLAILPIGTGNDLAIELGWLSALRCNSLSIILEKVMRAQVVDLDRWRFLPAGKESSDQKGTPNRNVVTFQNYCGFGVDAQIVLQFHLLRKTSPEMFFHEYINKFWYGIMGWNEIWSPTNESFSNQVEIFCDGVPVPIPADFQGVVFVNIGSYGGGSCLWRDDDFSCLSVSASTDADTSDDYGMKVVRSGGDLLQLSSPGHWKRKTANDGVMELVGVRNSLELAQIKLGITSCQKLAQGKRFELFIKEKIPSQFDGEPRIQTPGRFVIDCSEEKAKLLKPVPDDMDQDLVEVLDWAQKQNVITSIQQRAIMQEYIQRVERRQLVNFL